MLYNIGTAAAAAADNNDNDDDNVGVRVKELGPGEIKPSSDTPPAAAGGISGSSLLSAQKSDLALLRNANVRPVTSLPYQLRRI